MTRTVLVAVDGSPPSEAAVEFVATERPSATVILFHIVDPSAVGYDTVATTAERWYDSERERADELLDAAADQLPETATVERLVEVGRPASTIAEVAEREDVDHVVLGSHGRSGISRVILGSVAEKVVRTSPVPVTVAR
jgi:Universal stress protein UspA and related nucleotide-binding proteins